MTTGYRLCRRVIAPARSLFRRATAHRITAPACGRRGRKEQGNVLVEVALSLPLLLLVFTGIFYFGIAYSNQLTLTQAVGAGAQYLQQIRTSTSDPCADTLTAIENAAPTLTTSKISLTLNLNGTPETNKTTCSGAQQYLAEQEPVTVTATYPCSLPIVFTRGTTWVSTCSLTARVTEFEY
ncbi:MAG: TadE/TadG family type IV pilus assembly protein [Thermoguttaceae bacterium]